MGRHDSSVDEPQEAKGSEAIEGFTIITTTHCLKRSRALRVGILSAFCLLGLGGCAIGPRYHSPHAPSVHRYTPRHEPQTTSAPGGKAGAAQRFRYGVSPPLQWWTAFRSTAIDHLVALALRRNPTLATDRARLLQARAVVAADEGVFYPQVNGNLGAARQKSSAVSHTGSGAGIYSLYTGGVSVSYYPDVFGVNKLVYNSAESLARYQRDQLLAAQLTLIGNVVTTAVQAASDQAQVAATHRIIRSETRLLALTRMQYRAGAVPYLSVVNQESQLATSKAALPGLLQQLATVRYALADLIGEFPAQWRPIHLRLSHLYLPRSLPVSLPSVLVKNRPDIRAATEQLRYANAEVGIADAQFYPTVQLTATFGQESLTPGSFFNSASNVWSLAGSLLAPIFHGGTLRAQRQEAIDLYAGTLATYRATVLGAFQQVAGVLRALSHDAQALSDERAAYQASREALTLAQESYRAGAIDSLSLLTTEALYSQARIAYVRAEAQRYLDTVALYTAIGGGRLPPAASLLGPPQATTKKTASSSVSPAKSQRNKP